MGGPGSGGRRVRSGPPQDPNAIRRGRTVDRSGFERLPVSGRESEAPAWPLPGRPTKFERERWAIEWAKPQAIMWERLGWEVQVAMYIRTLRVASSGKAAAQVTSNALRQMDMLGLSQAGLAANRWIIEDAAPTAAGAPRTTGVSAKERLRMIRGGADARAS